MTNEEQDALLGLSVSDAEVKVREAGFRSYVYHKNDIVAAISIAPTHVVLLRDDDNIVVNVYNQRRIDEEYQRFDDENGAYGGHSGCGGCGCHGNGG